MQIKKEDIKERIISSARSEFLEHGYSGASLRVIANKAGLTKGAVYSYFKSKDSLFCELVSPAINFLKCSNDNKQLDVLTDPCDRTIQEFRRFASAVLDNYQAFRLLLFCSAGSSLQNYKEHIIQQYAKNFRKAFLLFTSEQYEEGLFSEMFIHTLATTYFSFLEEIVLHRPDKQDINLYIDQIAVFVHCGINNLLQHVKSKDK